MRLARTNPNADPGRITPRTPGEEVAMRRFTTVRTVLALATMATLVALGTAPGAAQAQGNSQEDSGWTSVPIPRLAGLLAVSGTSTSDVWAVGYIYNQQFAVYRPVAMHSAGGAFVDTKVPLKGRG